MARPLSIFEQYSKAILPPPDQRQRVHLVKSQETAIQIANAEYNLQIYDPVLWRKMLEANSVDNPMRLSKPIESGGYMGRVLQIPARELPDFTS